MTNEQLKSKALQLGYALKFQGIELDIQQLMFIVLSFEALEDEVIPFSIDTALEIGKKVYDIKKQNFEKDQQQEP